MTAKVEYRLDPGDRMRAMEVGSWAQEKHDLLAKYIYGTRSMRGRFHRSTYIELFSGPGRLWLKPRGGFVDGSALRAWKASKQRGAAFDEIYINDLDRTNVDACTRRLESEGAVVHAFNLPADEAGPAILRKIGSGVHLVLLDPFGISVLPFELVEAFARYDNMDLVVNYSILDVRRNLPQNLRGESKAMDRFCPGWRDAVSGVHGKRAQRGRVLERWLQLLSGTGAKYSREIPLVHGSRRSVHLYHLVFAAHHDSPLRVWSDIAKGGQGSIFQLD